MVMEIHNKYVHLMNLVVYTRVCQRDFSYKTSILQTFITEIELFAILKQQSNVWAFFVDSLWFYRNSIVGY